MASTYSANLGIEKPGLGDQSGTWGTTVNTGLDIIDRALGRRVDITPGAVTYTVTTTDGTLSEGQNFFLRFNGTPGADCTVTIAPNDAQRVYRIKNNFSDGYNVIVKQGTGATVTVKPTFIEQIWCDGGGAGAEVWTMGRAATGEELHLTAKLTVASSYTSTSPAFYISGGLVNIGTKNGTAPLTVSGAPTISATAPTTGTILHLSQVAATRTRILLDGFGTLGTIFSGRMARGTIAAPTAVQAGDSLANFTGIGYGASAYQTQSAGWMSIQASENWTDTAQGSRIEFALTPNGQAATTTKNYMNQNGSMTIGKNSAVTASMLAVVGLATYADNAAALVGGLTAGDFYRKADGTLMVTY